MNNNTVIVKKENNFFINIYYSIFSLFRENLGILIGFVILCILLSFISPVFLTQKNIMNVLRQVSTNLYLACAMTMVIILGGIDLSVGSIIALSGVVTGGLIAFKGYSVFIAVIIGLIVGTLVGVFNGFIISTTNIPPFIVTLSTMNIAVVQRMCIQEENQFV